MKTGSVASETAATIAATPVKRPAILAVAHTAIAADTATTEAAATVPPAQCGIAISSGKPGG